MEGQSNVSSIICAKDSGRQNFDFLNKLTRACKIHIDSFSDSDYPENEKNEVVGTYTEENEGTESHDYKQYIT